MRCRVAARQVRAYVVARALSEGEAYGLYDGHNREGYAHGGCGLCADAANVECGYDVVDTGNEHTDNGRNSHY